MNFLLILSLALLLETCPNPFGSDDAEYLKLYCPDLCILREGENEIQLNSGFFTITKNSSAFLNKFEPLGELIELKNFSLSNKGEEICIMSREGKDCFHYGKDIEFLDEGVVYFRRQKWDFKYENWSNFSCVSDFLRGKLIITPTNFTAEGFRIASYNFFAKFEPNELYVDAKAGTRCGIDANHLSGSYRNFHYKFGLKGNEVVITTENWVFTKKGYIVHFESEKFAKVLSELLEYDKRFLIKKETCSGQGVESKEGKGKSIEFTANVTLLIMPDCNPVLDFIKSAKKRVYIIAPYIGFEWFDNESLLVALKEAKKRGKVVVILDEAPKEADILIDEGIEVKKVQNLHGKAIVVDDKVLITSANMNMYGLKLNREIGVIIESAEVANFIIDDIEKKIGFEIALVPLIVFFVAILLLSRFRDKIF
ncbi:MAG: phospholipase D-like domain-containing protein [Archaeoglobaceae archaeon]